MTIKILPITLEKDLAKTLKDIDRAVDKTNNIVAAEVAASVVSDAREILAKAVMEHGGTWTGRLAESIMAKKADMGMKSYQRWDVVVNTNRAPYAEWVELGKYAGSLPYSKSGEKDYSKSKFTGYRYLGQSVERNTGKAPNIFNRVWGVEVKKLIAKMR